MKLVIHMGAHQVGGSCVELSHQGSTILVDIGLPLDCDMDEDSVSYLPKTLSRLLQKKEKRIDAVLLSHAHLDHSAFDAYGFLVEAGGKSLFYTGDFRGHGRKAKLLDKLIKHPPQVNVLLMEGTLVGERTDELTVSEDELQKDFFRAIEETAGMCWYRHRARTSIEL